MEDYPSKLVLNCRMENYGLKFPYFFYEPRQMGWKSRKKFANIINQVAFGDESFVLTRRGAPIAAIVSMRELKLSQEIEDQIDIEDAWKAKNEFGKPILWEELKKELEL